MLYEYNAHARSFQMEKERLNDDNFHNLELRLISNRTLDGRIYNQPIVSEVVTLTIGDVDTVERDIIMKPKGVQLHIIYEFHASYLAYQYPLFFFYDEFDDKK